MAPFFYTNCSFFKKIKIVFLHSKLSLLLQQVGNRPLFFVLSALSPVIKQKESRTKKKKNGRGPLDDDNGRWTEIFHVGGSTVKEVLIQEIIQMLIGSEQGSTI